MTLALLGKIWLLNVVIGVSALAIFYSLFVQLPTTAPRSMHNLQRFGTLLLAFYVGIVALLSIGLGTGFGVVVFRHVLAP